MNVSSCKKLLFLFIFFATFLLCYLDILKYIVSFSFHVLNLHWLFKSCRIKPRLENPSFRPSKNHILSVFDNFVDILKIRYSSPLFRLSTASDIEVHVLFMPISSTCSFTFMLLWRNMCRCKYATMFVYLLIAFL